MKSINQNTFVLHERIIKKSYVHGLAKKKCIIDYICSDG